MLVTNVHYILRCNAIKTCFLLQKLISEVKIQVDNQIQGLHFNITAICPDGSKKTGMEGCKNVGYNKEVC